MSGVPQGSALGVVSSMASVSDSNEDLTCPVSKLADDTILTARVTAAAKIKELQSDLDCLVDSSKKCQMKFNLSKYKVFKI